MSRWSRIVNVFRSDRLNREIDEEIQSHIEDALAAGRDPSEVRKAVGEPLRLREYSRDVRLACWLDSLRTDVLFGFRQLLKNKVSAGAAILSLALAIGACTSAFRLIDAVLLRPLPVAAPERLFVLTYALVDPNGKTDTGDSFEYPVFRKLRETVKDQAQLLAVSYPNRQDLTFGSDAEMEKAYRQYVSGETFGTLGLQAAAGRLLTPNDDLRPGGHPQAVLSYEYWTRRFGRDPKAVGRTFQMGGQPYEIVGVCAPSFTGTETGTLTDIFVPTMMNAKAVNNQNWAWFRTWASLKPGVAPDLVREKLQAAMQASRREYANNWSAQVPKERIEQYVSAPLYLEPAAAGVSGMQRTYRLSLTILGVLVLLVLLIACANVANLMTAQAATRTREMALRVSIGAGRSRLVQLLLIESALLALTATLLGAMFAWWSAPFVVSMLNPASEPVRLILPADARVLGFSALLALAVTVLFGLVPALRASGIRPISALRGGEDPHSRRRLMNALVASQVAFCFLVHLLAGLFVTTFDRLSHQPLGFSSDRLLILDTVAAAEQPVTSWEQVTAHLTSVGGVESVAMSDWALMSGNAMSTDIWVNGRSPERFGPYFLSVSPGWIRTMRIHLLEGRDFRPNDKQPAVALVNEAFAKHYFDGNSPVGKHFERMVDSNKKRVPTEIVGMVRDARYTNMRDPIRATVYLPLDSTDASQFKSDGSLIIRTTSFNPLSLATILRQEVPRVRSEFRVSNIHTQEELVRQHTLRERLLAMLSLFFGTVALILAAVGLYGVLNYSVVQRQREIGIRMALGARAPDVVRRVTAEVFAMLLLGAAGGLATGIASERYIETLLYEVRTTDTAMFALPALAIFAAALLAALPPVIRAVRIDPAVTLRSE